MINGWDFESKMKGIERPDGIAYVVCDVETYEFKPKGKSDPIVDKYKILKPTDVFSKPYDKAGPFLDIDNFDFGPIYRGHDRPKYDIISKFLELPDNKINLNPTDDLIQSINNFNSPHDAGSYGTGKYYSIIGDKIEYIPYSLVKSQLGVLCLDEITGGYSVKSGVMPGDHDADLRDISHAVELPKSDQPYTMRQIADIAAGMSRRNGAPVVIDLGKRPSTKFWIDNPGLEPTYDSATLIPLYAIK